MDKFYLKKCLSSLFSSKNNKTKKNATFIKWIVNNVMLS